MGLSFLGLGSLEAAPVKTIDFADDGNNCERINDKCIAMGSGYISVAWISFCRSMANAPTVVCQVVLAGPGS